MSSLAQEASQRPLGRRRRTWVVGCFVTGVASFLGATALVVLLQRKLVVAGPFSTLGLTPFIFLISVWCLSAALVGLLLGRDGRLARVVAGAAAFFVFLAVAVVTNVLGTATYVAASTPLHRITTDRGHGAYLVRLGTVLESDRLSLYRSEGRWFELVGDAGFATPDTEKFAKEHHVDQTRDGSVLVYPTRDGRMARIELPG